MTYTVNSRIESGALFRIQHFGPGFYSNQDLIQVRTLFNFERKLEKFYEFYKKSQYFSVPIVSTVHIKYIGGKIWKSFNFLNKNSNF